MDAKKKVGVWDVAVRAFHWALALLVLGSFLTAEEDASVPLHVRIGVGIAGLVAFRLVWGIWGTEPARFRSFVRSPREVLAYARTMLGGRPPVHESHNPVGAVMVVVLLATLLATVITGALAYAGPAWDGPLTGLVGARMAHGLEETHEALAELLPWLIGLHVAGVIVSSLLERQNLVLGMVTGRKRASRPAPVRATPLRLAGAGAVAAAVIAVLLALLQPGVARADVASARSLGDGYERDARAEGAARAAPDRDAGARLYATSGARGQSCATCHGADPRGAGRTPAGKNLGALSPLVNPDRFRDRGDVEKWFGRNCKQVLGRACTAREKADFITYLLAP